MTTTKGFRGKKKTRLCGLLLGRGGSGDDAHDVGLLHDQKFLTIQLHLGAGPLAEQDLVACRDVESHKLTRFVAGAGTYGDDFAFHRLFLGRIGDDDSSGGLFFSGQAPDYNPVVQGAETHFKTLLSSFSDEMDRYNRPQAWMSGDRLLALPGRECQRSSLDGFRSQALAALFYKEC